MPETTETETRRASAAKSRESDAPGTALQASRGATNIADSVITKVAGIAAREVAGIHALGGSGARALGSVGERVGLDTRSQGVSVEVSDRTATIALTVVVEYGESIPAISEEVREQVIRRVEGICGLSVPTVDITVDDLHFAGDDAEDQDRS